MKRDWNTKELRELTLGVECFSPDVLEWIARENLWNLWVPKDYGGLEMSLPEGLNILKGLARIDGSLGWTITLCCGANYFIGNLKEEVAQEIFVKPEVPVCFGGSGAVGGTAEKLGDHYRISGKWPYATGAPYLTHFTLNAGLTENGKTLKDKDGTPVIRSFIIPLKDIQIIKDGNAMGLRASATHSFEVRQAIVHERYSFGYNRFYLPQSVFRIHFSVFAALTLWANYIGIAEHFSEESGVLGKNGLAPLARILCTSKDKMQEFAGATENISNKGGEFTEAFIQELYVEARNSVRSLSREIVLIYPFLGIHACRNDSQINQVFRDYFTATQHHIFTRKI